MRKPKNFFTRNIYSLPNTKQIMKSNTVHFIQTKCNNGWAFTSRNDQPSFPGRPGPSAPSFSCRRWDSLGWGAVKRDSKTVEGKRNNISCKCHFFSSATVLTPR